VVPPETIEKDIEQVVLKTYGSDTQRDTLRSEVTSKAETDEQSANPMSKRQPILLSKLSELV
jgi:hypothetical protein